MWRQNIDKEGTDTQWKNRLLKRLAQEKQRNPVNTLINADLSLSSSDDGSEKVYSNQFVPVPMKVSASLSK